jgi:hypothetical protein
MLYPIETVTYNLPISLGLPFDIPFRGPCQFYKNSYQYVQLKLTVPYQFPSGYSIKILLTSATIVYGTAYANFESLIYDPLY